ncbi:hypothetical protein BVRB_6g140000 [Beta vulgaris subsp. vulgaris]|nr:hypothetical protein BVRB_6g140000 [Beta vulgaris subsp. vulgaris]
MIKSFFTSCFHVEGAIYDSNNKRNTSKEVAKTSKEKGGSSSTVLDPEATIIASAKHFSSAHKVRL